MFVAIHHTIHQPDQFWRVIDGLKGKPNSAARIRQVLRNQPGDRAVLLWEAASIEAARELVEGAVGEFSQNEYEPVKSLRSWRITRKQSEQ